VLPRNNPVADSHDEPIPVDQPNTASKPKLTLDNKLYEGDWIYFNVTIPRGLNKKDYVLVQWMTGCNYGKDGEPTYANHMGKKVFYEFPEWTIDSTDPDPVYGSIADQRWNYQETDTGFQSKDKPGHGPFSAVQFRTELHRIQDVPIDGGDNPKLPTPIDVKRWDSAWCETSQYNLHPKIEGYCDLGKWCPKPKKQK